LISELVAVAVFAKSR